MVNGAEDDSTYADIIMLEKLEQLKDIINIQTNSTGSMQYPITVEGMKDTSRTV